MKEMNLLPEEYLYKLEQKKKRRLYILLIVLLILVLVVFYLTLYLKEYTLRKEIIDVKSKIEGLEKVKDIQLEISSSQEVLKSRLAMVKNVESKRVDHFIFFNELEKTLPREITLVSLTHPNGKNFHIDGTTTNPDKIAELMVNLAKIESAENINLDSVNYEREDGQGNKTIGFDINFTYSIEEEGKSNDTNQ